MEEELNYVTVTFRTNYISTPEKPNDLEIIYDEVKTGEQAWDTIPVIPENKKKAPSYTLLQPAAAGLGIICVILVSVVVTLCIHLNAVMSEQHRENTNLTAQNLQLWMEKSTLEKQMEALTREKDGLNWTIGVILKYEDFPVKTYCPQKACKPCLDGWVLFQSNCYLFTDSNYTSGWKCWEDSRESCRETKADLVVIDSKEEQEFINNHTKAYDDEMHGYWIGWSSKNMAMWADGSNFTVTYWKPKRSLYKPSCALTLPRADPLANWNKASCNMKNRWICETRALIKQSKGLSKMIT